MTVTASHSNGVVTLATGNVEFDIQYGVDTFEAGHRINAARVGGVMVAEQSFVFLKIGHRPKAYWAGPTIDARTGKGRHFGYWDADRRSYGVRTVNGVQEGYVRGTFVCRNPEATIGAGISTFMNFEVDVELVLRDGTSWVDRTDTFDCEDWYHTQEMTHFWQLPDNEEDPDGYDTNGAEAILKQTIEGGETIPSLTGPVSLSQSNDRLVGNKSLRIQVPSGNAGAEVEWPSTYNWNQDRFFSYRLKPLTSTARPEAIRWYVKDSSGGKQYISPVVELLLDLILDGDKKGHTRTGIWRQSFWDLDGTTRSNVTAWGFEVLTNDNLDFLFDDCWIYQRRTENMQNVTGGPDLWTTMAAFPDGFVDENVGGDLTKDFQRLAREPFMCGHVTSDSGSSHWGVSVQSKYRDSVAIIRLVGSVEVTEKYYVDDSYTGGLTIYEDDKGFYVTQTRTRYLPHVGVRQNARVISGDLKRFQFKSRFAVTSGTSRNDVFNKIQNAYNDFDVSPVANKTAADLPDIGPFHKLFQNKATTKYEQARWLRDMYERLGDGRFCENSEAGLIAIHRIFRNPVGWLMNDDPVNMVLDTKQDLLQLYIDVFGKTTGQPVVWESTAAIFESAKKDIPHYRPIHMAGNKDGTRDNRLFFIFTSDEGFTVLRKENAENYPFNADTYDDIFEDGRVYKLNYTYPAHLVSPASLFHRAGDPGWKHGADEPTVGDLRFKSLDELVHQYEIDGIAMAEDCIYYSRCFAPEDLFSFNYWRQNIRSPSLPVLADFQRLDNTQPVSASNPYKADDPEIWAWLAWLSKKYMAQVRDLLHSKGVLSIVDVNVDSTIGLQDKDALDSNGDRIYEESLLKQQDDNDPFPGTWNTRQFDLQGRRNGIDVYEILDACDMAYIWLYGAYGPWGAVDANNYFLDWAAPKHLQGRYMCSPGLYPRASRVPSAPDLKQMMKDEADRGFSVVVPSGKVLGQFVDDYWSRLLEGFSAVDVPRWDAATKVVSVSANRGVYFPKAQSGVTVSAPGTFNVYHHDRAHTQKAAYEPYAGESLTIAAGDSISIEGVGVRLPSVARIRSAYQKGFGPVHAVIKWTMEQAGIPDDRWADPNVIDSLEGYFRNRPSDLRNILVHMQQAFSLTMVESNGQLVFAPEGPGGIAVPADATQELQNASVDLRDPTSGASDLVVIDEIEWDDLGAVKDNIEAPSQRLTTRRMLETELPNEVQITFLDPNKAFDSNSTYDRRLVSSSRSVERIDFPIAMFPNQARRSAQKLLYRQWANRVHYEGKTTQKYIELDPGDIINLAVGEGETARVQITSMRAETHSLIEFTAKSAAENVFVSVLEGDRNVIEQTIPSYRASIFVPLDIPALREQDQDGDFYYTVLREGSPWRSAELQRSTDGGTTYSTFKFFPSDVVGGIVETVLPDGPEAVWDEKSTVQVRLTDPSAQIDSRDRLAVLAGANTAVIGKEIVSFTTATQIDTDTYELSGFIRGIRGTAVFSGDHSSSETFILLNSALVFRDGHPIGREYDYRAVSFNEDPEDANTKSFTNTGAALKPFAPVHVRGSFDGTGEWTIRWKRQTRIFHTWPRTSEPPLGEVSEEYEVDIIDTSDGSVARTLTVSSAQTVKYTPADQIEDFGAVQTSLSVKVYQMSAEVGRGFTQETTL